jgi:hypothetical protein
VLVRALDRCHFAGRGHPDIFVLPRPSIGAADDVRRAPTDPRGADPFSMTPPTAPAPSLPGGAGAITHHSSTTPVVHAARSAVPPIDRFFPFGTHRHRRRPRTGRPRRGGPPLVRPGLNIDPAGTESGATKEHEHRTPFHDEGGTPGAAHPGEPHDPDLTDPSDRRRQRAGGCRRHARGAADGPGGRARPRRGRRRRAPPGLQDHGLREVQVRPVQERAEEPRRGQAAGAQGDPPGAVDQDRPARRADPRRPGAQVPDGGAQGADHPALPRA